MHRLKTVVALIVSVLTVATVVSGCGPSGPAYVESTAQYTRANLAPLFQSARESDLLGSRASSAAELRYEALVGLRSSGAGGAAAADLITDTFPADTRGVPVHIEKAEFEAAPALMLLELTGPGGRPLDDVRLWVIDDSGEVVYSEIR